MYKYNTLNCIIERGLIIIYTFLKFSFYCFTSISKNWYCISLLTKIDGFMCVEKRNDLAIGTVALDSRHTTSSEDLGRPEMVRKDSEERSRGKGSALFFRSNNFLSVLHDFF